MLKSISFHNTQHHTTHKDAHYHDITMAKCEIIVNPNAAGAIGVMGIVRIVFSIGILVVKDT